MDVVKKGWKNLKKNLKGKDNELTTTKSYKKYSKNVIKVVEDISNLEKAVEFLCWQQRKTIVSLMEWARSTESNEPLKQFATSLSSRKKDFKYQSSRVLATLEASKKKFSEMMKTFDELPKKELALVRTETKRKKAKESLKRDGYNSKHCENLETLKTLEKQMRKEMADCLLSCEFVTLMQFKSAMSLFTGAHIDLGRAMVATFADIDTDVDKVIPENIESYTNEQLELLFRYNDRKELPEKKGSDNLIDSESVESTLHSPNCDVISGKSVKVRSKDVSNKKKTKKAYVTDISKDKKDTEKNAKDESKKDVQNYFKTGVKKEPVVVCERLPLIVSQDIRKKNVSKLKDDHGCRCKCKECFCFEMINKGEDECKCSCNECCCIKAKVRNNLSETRYTLNKMQTKKKSPFRTNYCCKNPKIPCNPDDCCMNDQNIKKEYAKRIGNENPKDCFKTAKSEPKQENYNATFKEQKQPKESNSLSSSPDSPQMPKQGKRFRVFRSSVKKIQRRRRAQ